MDILFLTLSNISSIYDRGIYTDLIRKLSSEGHNIKIMSPIERKHKEKNYIITQENVEIHKIKIGNITKTNLLEKGITTILIDDIYKHYFKKELLNNSFDLIMYSTPPITFIKTITFVKLKTNATTYLLLKDIFPQNAVDLNMIKKNSVIHKYFLNKEKNLYIVSDLIGCMSKANCDYIIENNISIVDKRKVHELPNSIELNENNNFRNKKSVREEFGIPKDKKVFIYGGNIGKPQNISFLLNILDRLAVECKEAFFVIVGNGTEFKKTRTIILENKYENVIIRDSLPKDKFDELVNASDVGLIFLDSRFSIPNFPSRILSYMEAKLPILAATDSATDLGKIIEENNFGFWCSSDDSDGFVNKCKIVSEMNLESFSKNSYNFLLNNYLVQDAYKIMIDKIKEK